MLLDALDKKIRQSFSDAALQYEMVSTLQAEIGRELMDRVKDKQECRRILDVGMGTGRMANRLSFFYPDAKIVGIDIAPGMLKVAKAKYNSYAILQADGGYLPFQSGAFDVIYSNLAYQWIRNLPYAFKQAHDCLSAGGQFNATMFARGTLCELFESLAAASGRPIHPDDRVFERLAGHETIRSALQEAGFSNIEMKSEIIKTHFKDMITLMKWIKEIGANLMRGEVFIGKETLRRANEYYQQHYQDRWGVTASFEIVWIHAIKT